MFKTRWPSRQNRSGRPIWSSGLTVIAVKFSLRILGYQYHSNTSLAQRIFFFFFFAVGLHL